MSQEPKFAGSVNVAMKIPKAQYEATVTFYRDVLGFPITAVDTSSTPTVATSHSVQFGPITLWLDRVDNYSRHDVWLEVETDHLGAAMQRLASAGINACDEVEPFVDPDFRSHWIANPAGVVHHLVERSDA